MSTALLFWFIKTTKMGNQSAKPETKVDVTVDNTVDQDGGVHLAVLDFHQRNSVLSMVIMLAVSIVVLFLFNRYCKKRLCNRPDEDTRNQVMELQKAIEGRPLVTTTTPGGVIIAGREFAPLPLNPV